MLHFMFNNSRHAPHERPPNSILQNEAAAAVFAVLLFLLFFEDAEGFAWEI
jgi:hypothetical protein